MPQETIGKSINGITDFSLPLPILTSSAVLTANTEQTYQAPKGFNRVFFSYSAGANVFVDQGSAPVSLPGGSFANDTKELNPGVRQLKGDGSELLRFISDVGAYVNLRFDQGST